MSYLVWIGDSLTAYWMNTGRAVWDRHYAALESVNTGISGAPSTLNIQQVERDGILDGLNSSVVVIMTGGNDLKQLHLPGTIIANVTTLVGLVKEKLPAANVLLLGLLPADLPDLVIEIGKVINAGYARLDNGNDIRFLDMTRQFADANDRPLPELYTSDGVHLSSLGYDRWQATMNPLFQELLG